MQYIFSSMARFFITVLLMLASVGFLYSQETGGSFAIEENTAPAAQTAASAASKTVFALRSNLLLPALNIGAEIPVGNKWSFAADYYYPWLWPGKKNKQCFEFLGWSAEWRYWFGKERTAARRLQGHSMALYGAGGYYDFQKDYKGKQGEFYSCGLDYTYSTPLGKREKVFMEFTIAVGYLRSDYRKYEVLADYGPLFKEDGEYLFDYIGPTKAAVSLVIPIRKKEGRK